MLFIIHTQARRGKKTTGNNSVECLGGGHFTLEGGKGGHLTLGGGAFYPGRGGGGGGTFYPERGGERGHFTLRVGEDIFFCPSV